MSGPVTATGGSTHAGATEESFDAVVVGAGIAGLCAARALLAAGWRVLVVDKGRGVGGRMATRRVGEATADHGAQGFQVRGAAFNSLVCEARAAGVVSEWSAGEATLLRLPGRLPVYRGTSGMSGPPKWLAASLVDAGCVVRTATRADAIARSGDRVVVHLEHGSTVTARGALLTPPVPQSIDLLSAGGLCGDLLPGTRDRLADVEYDPCFALILVLDRTGMVPPPGGIRFGDSVGPIDGDWIRVAVPDGFPLAWIADNRLKGISARPCLTLHATASFSRERFEVPTDQIATTLIDAARPWIDGGRHGPVMGIVERIVHRWKYAIVARGCHEPFLPVHEGPPLVICGDAFGDRQVEGAADSGLAAGAWLAGRLV